MKESFVLIFRQGDRKLTDVEQLRRTEEVRDWAIQRINESTALEPRVLDNQSYHLGDERAEHDSDGQVIALNFLEATSFDEAVAISKTHPGLRYGIRIEVRRWRDPRAQQAAAGVNTR